MTDPVLEASRALLADSFTEIRKSLSRLSETALNWRPGDDTNSLAVIVTHALGSARGYVHLALDAPLPHRVRAEEFETITGSSAELQSVVELAIRDTLAAIDGATAFEPAAHRIERPGEEVTAAWALLHAVEHLREHVGQMFLTRQLWETSRA